MPTPSDVGMHPHITQCWHLFLLEMFGMHFVGRNLFVFVWFLKEKGFFLFFCFFVCVILDFWSFLGWDISGSKVTCTVV